MKRIRRMSWKRLRWLGLLGVMLGLLAGLWWHYAPRTLRVVARFSYALPEYERGHGLFFHEKLDPVSTGMLIDAYFSYSGTWVPFDETLTFRDWDGNTRWQLAVPPFFFPVVATSPDGRWVAILRDRRIEIWHDGQDVAPGRGQDAGAHAIRRRTVAFRRKSFRQE